MTYREFFVMNDMQRQKLKEQLPKIKENNKELFDINKYKCRINEIRNDKYCYLSNNNKLKVEEVIYYVEHGMFCLSNPSVLENWKGWDKEYKTLNLKSSIYPYRVVAYKKFVNDDSFNSKEKNGSFKILHEFVELDKAEEFLHKTFWKDLCKMCGMSFNTLFAKYSGLTYKEITIIHWADLLDTILETEGQYSEKVINENPKQFVFLSDWHQCYFRGIQFELNEVVDNSAMSGKSVEFYWEIRKNKG